MLLQQNLRCKVWVDTARIRYCTVCHQWTNQSHHWRQFNSHRNDSVQSKKKACLTYGQVCRRWNTKIWSTFKSTSMTLACWVATTDIAWHQCATLYLSYRLKKYRSHFQTSIFSAKWYFSWQALNYYFHVNIFRFMYWHWRKKILHSHLTHSNFNGDLSSYSIRAFLQRKEGVECQN